MRRIRYAGDSVVTGDDIASMVIEYSEALAKANTAASIEIPVRLGTGGIGMATLLVGPASQLISSTEDLPHEEIEDPELVADLQRKTVNLRRFGTSETGNTIAEDREPPLANLSEFDDL